MVLDPNHLHLVLNRASRCYAISANDFLGIFAVRPGRLFVGGGGGSSSIICCEAVGGLGVEQLGLPLVVAEVQDAIGTRVELYS